MCIIGGEVMKRCVRCGAINTKINYHHWDIGYINEERVMYGVWVCNYCHLIVEAFEKRELFDVIEKYTNLKEKLYEEGF